ncbi:MAG: hypothetical protein Q9191_003330, partial [Dirinaria sp. TL-2023a]
MKASYDPNLTQSDVAVWQNLKRDIGTAEQKNLDNFTDHDDLSTVQFLTDINSTKSESFQPTVFTTWDEGDLPPLIEKYIVQPYASWAKTVVRRPTDVVFLTHILLYLFTSVPSAVGLYCRFTWSHAVIHWVMQAYYSGSFTLMLHNHIHNNGVLAPEYSLFDKAWPYILEPLMGHTWDSYYHHHVKHHHVENNGPGDLSSTIRFQRDSLLHFSLYVGRFLLLVWIELPLYFLRKRKPRLAFRTVASELTSYALIYFLARHNLRTTMFVLVIPLIQMRIAMMIGNWGQHALVDDEDPDSDFRSSITLIDVPSNRHCFNDGYHTSHHLNPRRHWRDHPVAFVKAKAQYREGRALTFHKIDYIMMTITLLRKDYMHLASCLIPMGDQIRMSQTEIAEMLRSKTKRFSEEDIMR